MSMDSRTPQENGALILRAQVEAATLLLRAQVAEESGLTDVAISFDEARELASSIKKLSEIPGAEGQF